MYNLKVQSQIVRPEEALFLLQFLLPQLKSEQAVTHKIISAVPADREDYRPDARSKSAFELARHIALVEIWILDAVISKRFEEAVRPVDAVRTCLDAARWFAGNVARCMERLVGLPGDHLATLVNLHGLRNDSAVAYLNIAIRHSVHHRGQLSAYLRPMGTKVPAIYVESADEPFPPIDGSIPEQPPPAF